MPMCCGEWVSTLYHWLANGANCTRTTRYQLPLATNSTSNAAWTNTVEAGEAPQRTNALGVVPREDAALPLGGEHPVPVPPEGPAKLLLHYTVEPGNVEGKDPDEGLPAQRVAGQDDLHLVLVMGRVAVMAPWLWRMCTPFFQLSRQEIA